MGRVARPFPTTHSLALLYLTRSIAGDQCTGDTGGHVRRGRCGVPLHGRSVRVVLQVRREAGEARLPGRTLDGQPADGSGPVETDGSPETGRIRGAAARRFRGGHDHVQRPKLVELRQLGHLLFHRGHDHR